MKQSEEFQLAIEQIRMQRHDFMNYLQVIYGYLQIEKPEEAINYIKNINQKMVIFSQLFNLENPIFALLMQDVITNSYKLGFSVEFESELEYISLDFSEKNIDNMKAAFEKIKSVFFDLYSCDCSEGKSIYISLYESSGELCMTLSSYIDFENDMEKDDFIELADVIFETDEVKVYNLKYNNDFFIKAYFNR